MVVSAQTRAEPELVAIAVTLTAPPRPDQKLACESLRGVPRRAPTGHRQAVWEISRGIRRSSRSNRFKPFNAGGSGQALIQSVAPGMPVLHHVFPVDSLADAATAVLWYRKAASQGLAVAQTNLGIMFNDGIGVPRNPGEAAKWFELAARQGDPSALNNLGVLYDKGDGVPEDDRKAVELLTRAAELGHPRAMSNLGLMYRLGEGVPEDAATATRWFRSAADKKDLEGINNLGVMLDQGLGAAQDRTKAMSLFDAAARAGHPGAAVNLALMMMRAPATLPSDQEGERIRPLVKAYAWLNFAAGLGNLEARQYRAELHSKLTSEEIADAQRLSVAWSSKARMTVD